ncbi:hypothetical protein SAMN05660485_01581 [Blastococcus fimeti]|nr:hypothetical protein SAMN05660485_01581 [Blastococcus fimeti]
MSVSDPHSVPTRQMGEPAFRADQWRRRFDPHIAPVNHIVDSLKDVDGLFHRDLAQRQRRMLDRKDAYRATAAALRRSGDPE